MSQRIRKLASHVINQIAAGEVIERPASVIKELLENSLDAHATQIDIELQQGGKQLIRITDNGAGIEVDDLPLTVTSHATSKIVEFDDLAQVTSLGFRGEALASVCSVSRFALISRTSQADSAWRIDNESAQQITQPQPAAHPLGTTVQVEELFIHTPVRRKFLRMDKTEFMYSEEVAKRLAISHFSVGFKLVHDKRTLWQVHPAQSLTDQQARIRQLLGKTFLDHAVYLDIERDGLHLRGWVGLPIYFRSQTDQQYFYLNQRLVKDKLIHHAIRQVYADLLYPGRHAAYVLFLTMPPALVDVNVHPTKAEVRFRQSRMIHDFIVNGLGHALNQTSVSTSVDETLQSDLFSTKASVTNEVTQSDPAMDKAETADVDSKQTHLKTDAVGTIVSDVSMSSMTAVPEHKLNVSSTASETLHVHQPRAQYTTEIASHSQSTLPLGQAVAQVAKRFILARTVDNLMVCDYVAGKSLLIHQHLQQAYADTAIKTRSLLVPITVQATEQTVSLFAEYAPRWRALGWQVERLGEQQLLLRDIPLCVGQADVAFVFGQLLVYLTEHPAADNTELLPVIARHSVVLQRLTTVMMNDFLRELERTVTDVTFLIQHDIVRSLTEHTLQQFFAST
ncbi:MAG: DNA mismatch repair endonuclease MutL [Legionellales bacterium]|nr:DNA mismatch repair endonuclease MutL [Legionellales bacterium]